MSLRVPKKFDTNKGKAAAYAPKQERRLAKKLGASLTKASGAQSEKGDIRQRGIYRIECKSTENKSYSLTRETYHKIASAAASANEIPCMTVDFLNENGGVQESLAIISVENLKSILKELSNVRG
ncbi:MAG: hypothetical protein ABW007_19515 [Chitinophagaceae bacterium]